MMMMIDDNDGHNDSNSNYHCYKLLLTTWS